MDQLEMLWEYQKEDIAVDKLKNDIKRSPTRQKLVKYREALLEQKETSEQITNEISAMTDRLDALSDAIKMIDEQAAALKNKADAENTVSENVSRLISEAKRLQNNLSGYEQEAKHIRKDAADRDRMQRDIKVRFAKYKAEYEKLKSIYDVEFKESNEKLETLKNKAAEKAKGISPELMDKYRNIKLHSVPPLARLVGNQCGGGNMSLPSAVSRSIKAGQLIECETCGRLILPPLESSAL